MGQDKCGYQVNSFLIDENICCGYSNQNASNGCPQHMFLSGNKKKSSLLRKIRVYCQTDGTNDKLGFSICSLQSVENS